MTADYLLVSFAPSSGIGFFRHQEWMHEIDLVNDNTEPLQPDTATLVMRREHDQILVMESFETLTELKHRATREYLRDKKGIFYGLLLTGALPPAVERQTLQVLDEPSLAGVPVSSALAEALRDSLNVDSLRSTVSLAMAHGFRRVLRCLADELAPITFSEQGLLRAAIHTLHGEPETATAPLVALATLTSLARDLPRPAVGAIRQVVGAAEIQAPRLTKQALSAVRSVAWAVQSPVAVFDRALVAMTVAESVASYRRVLSDVSQPRLSELRRRLASSLPPPDTELRELGQQCGQVVREESSRINLLAQFPWQQWGRDTPTESPALRQCAAAFYSRCSRSSDAVFGWLPGGSPFELSMIPVQPPSRAEGSVPEGYARHLAFWLTFYADPTATLNLVAESNLKFAPELQLGLLYRYFDVFEEQPFTTVEVYELINRLSLGWLLGSRTSATRQVITWMEQEFEQVRRRSLSWSRHPTFPEPLGVVLGNLIAILDDAGEPASAPLLRAARWLVLEGIEVRPFVRFFI